VARTVDAALTHPHLVNLIKVDTKSQAQ
jgi:hypothetical protein